MENETKYTNESVTVKYQGETFYQTGKEGTCNTTGHATAEFESYYESGRRTGRRVWVSSTGVIVED